MAARRDPVDAGPPFTTQAELCREPRAHPRIRPLAGGSIRVRSAWKGPPLKVCSKLCAVSDSRTRRARTFSREALASDARCLGSNLEV
jgi:hypothetical protein